MRLRACPRRLALTPAMSVCMAQSSGEVIIVPRNFVLLGELEKAEKGNTDMSISYGLVEQDDITLSSWQCTILGLPNTTVENRIISLLLYCGKEYPDRPPTVQFQTKVNYPFIDSKGELIVSKGPAAFRDWNRSRSLETALTALRAEMAKNGNNKLPQPAEGLIWYHSGSADVLSAATTAVAADVAVCSVP
eukprot:jgi/Chrpa1/13485/Chrysochromulina_OHIO_Genome00004360-RA